MPSGIVVGTKYSSAAVVSAIRDTEGTLPLSDTSPKAREIYYQCLSRMTPAQRINMGVALWKAGDSLQRAAIRRNNPDADEAEILFRLAVTRFGLELARKVYQRL